MVMFAFFSPIHFLQNPTIAEKERKKYKIQIMLQFWKWVNGCLEALAVHNRRTRLIVFLKEIQMLAIQQIKD
jgi:hypothetical protein